jgi:prevent-host-death family protein
LKAPEGHHILDQLVDQFGDKLVMREVGAYEAKTNLAALLDAVEKGETIVITRRGRAVARLGPAHRPEPEETARLIARMKKKRSGRAAVTAQEILAARDEGRR